LRCVSHQVAQPQARQDAGGHPGGVVATPQGHHRQAHPQRLAGRRVPVPGEHVQRHVAPVIRAQMGLPLGADPLQQQPCGCHAALGEAPGQTLRREPMQAVPSQQETRARHRLQNLGPQVEHGVVELLQLVQRDEGHCPVLVLGQFRR
jgi:hypothetical protein